jgi:Transcriptional regulators of sugar metabolism
MNKRELDILSIITERERVEVAKLAEELQVSQVTIRKDLAALETRGLIQREHGFALIGSQDDINNRLATNYEVKQMIAKEAASLVQNGETVIIESGSSCTLLADLLAATRQNITIITNSAFIANYIRKRPAAKMILLGGDYQNNSQVMVGSLVSRCVENFFVDKMFIGTDGFSVKTGFTSRDYARAETVRQMAQQANKVIILTDSGKFRQPGVVSLLPLENVDTVITDSDIDQGSESYLASKDITIIKSGKFTH